MAPSLERKQIFISHKETDEAIAEALVDFILAAIEIADEDVLSTSVPGHQLAFGSSIAHQLRDRLDTATALIALLTRDSLRSTWVLFELGAAWAMKKIVVPILGPGLEFTDLPGPLNDYPGVKINADDASLRLKDAVKQIAAALGVNEKTGAKPDAKLRQFVSRFRAGTAATHAPPRRGSTSPPTDIGADVTKAITVRRNGADIATNALGMRLARIPAGSFSMGSDESEGGYRGERPRHTVTISREFYIGIFCVTQEEFESLMHRNPSRFSSLAAEPKVAGKDTRRFPVECVTWDEAVEFCSLLSELPEKKEARRAYRLPTEAEWEYACRSGTTTPFHVGSTLSRHEANFNENYPAKGNIAVEEVGRYPPNGFGLHDMHGNVQEWCRDWYVEDYYEWSPALDPTGPPDGTHRVVRGGCWSFQVHDCRSAYRSRAVPSRRDSKIGFRVVAEVRG